MAAGMGLSASEALVLTSLPRFDARKAIKIGLFSLLMRGILRLDVEERPGLLRKRQTVRLRLARDLPQRLPPPMESLVEVVRAAGPGGLMSDIVKQATRRYGRTLVGFVQKYVGPALVERGLAEQRQTRIFGLVPVMRFHPTPAGEAEKSRLEAAMREARAIPEFLERDQAQAVALAAAAGSAILLIDELKPHYQALSHAMRAADRSGGDYSGPIDLPTGHGDAMGASGLDAAAIDFDLGGFDLTAFDSFDAGFAAFDTGFDSAADTGGGGDGGSSGC